MIIKYVKYFYEAEKEIHLVDYSPT